MIWFILCCAGLSLFVGVLLARAFFSQNDIMPNRSALEKAAHLRQMAAIDDEEAFQRINQEEAQALRIEAQRRLLRSQRTLPNQRAPHAGAHGLVSAKQTWQSIGGLMLLAFSTALLSYALLGSPQIPSKPAPAKLITPQDQTALAQAQQALINNPDDTGAWLAFTTTLSSMGRTREAADALSFALQRMPERIDLWVALGITLVEHGGGEMNPAARLAFGKAARIDPKHPGPRLFLALAWLQAGKPQEALPVLEALEQDTPANAPWRPRLERMMRGAQAMLAAGVGQEANAP